MGEDKDLLLLLTRHLTCRYRLVNVPPVGQDTEIKERLPARPGAALHLMTSELTAPFTVILPRVLKHVKYFICFLLIKQIYFVQISHQRAFAPLIRI